MATYSVRAQQVIERLHDRPVAYHPGLVAALGGTDEALFVSQLLYWEGKGSTPGRWIYKTQPEWTRETGLSRYKQLRVRRRLLGLGVLEERLRGIPARLYYRLNLPALDALVADPGSRDERATESQACPGQDHDPDREAVPTPADETGPEPAGAGAAGQSSLSPPAITENTAQITRTRTADPGPHDPAEVWHRALPELAGSMPKRSYDCWIRPCALVSVEKQGECVHAVVEAPNEFIIEWLTSHLDVVVRRVLSGVVGSPVEVTYAQSGSSASPGGDSALAG